MFFCVCVNKTIDMKGQEICLNCPHMDPVVGYCPRVGGYVNAFWSCRQYEEGEPFEVEEQKPVRPRRVSPMKGVKLTENRTKKRCSRCGKIKPLEEFVRSNRNADGHGCYCLDCNREKNREQRARNKLKAAKYANDNSDK